MPNGKAVGLLVGTVLALLALFATYRHGVNTANARWELAIQKQKADAKKLLDDETEKVRAVQTELNQLKNEVEKRDEQAQRTIDDARAENRRLVAAAGGVLRDPGRRSGGSCTKTEDAFTPAEPVGETAGTELSVEATRFLLELAYEADLAAKYAQTCRDWLFRSQQLINAD